MNFEEKYKDEEIRMFFMNIYKKIDRDLTFFRSDRDRMGEYFFMLGCACQGRIKEVEYHYQNIIESEENQLFINHINDIKPLLLKLAAISDFESSKGLKGIMLGESLGEYEDRKVRANKDFMILYDTLRNTYIAEIDEFLQIKKIK